MSHRSSFHLVTWPGLILAFICFGLWSKTADIMLSASLLLGTSDGWAQAVSLWAIPIICFAFGGIVIFVYIRSADEEEENTSPMADGDPDCTCPQRRRIRNAAQGGMELWKCTNEKCGEIHSSYHTRRRRQRT